MVQVHFILMTSFTPHGLAVAAGGLHIAMLRGMTIPIHLRGTITVVAAGLSLALLAPREAFAQG
jgi:hypothetical protein